MGKNILFLMLMLSLFGCSVKKENNLKDKFKDCVLDNDIYSQYVSIVTKNSSQLEMIYSDERTLSLKYADYDIISQKHQINFIDKIDTSSDATFLKGKHVFLSDNTADYLFYIDYVSNKEKLFKILQRDRGEKNWQVFPSSIMPKDFTGLFFKNQIVLVTYDGEFKFFIFGNGQLNYINTQLKKINTIDVKGQLSLIYSPLFKTFYLFFLDINNRLYQINLKLSNKKTASLNLVDVKEIVISDNVLSYTIKIVNSVPYILYYSSDNGAFKINYRKENKTVVDTIGYFSSIQAIDFFVLNKKKFFIYSSPVDNKNITTDKKYKLLIVYNKDLTNKKPHWVEETIKYSDTPIINIKDIILKDKLFLILSGNRIDLLSINIKSLF